MSISFAVTVYFTLRFVGLNGYNLEGASASRVVVAAFRFVVSWITFWLITRN